MVGATLEVVKGVNLEVTPLQAWQGGASARAQISLSHRGIGRMVARAVARGSPLDNK
ncbi:MAG: hypothetical protein HC933_20990 [Pleurocapsa sp. SU_196_0]|nr:hypothetical protein [Pleurocapsa sp. SU_196_0]